MMQRPDEDCPVEDEHYHCIVCDHPILSMDEYVIAAHIEGHDVREVLQVFAWAVLKERTIIDFLERFYPVVLEELDERMQELMDQVEHLTNPGRYN